MDLGGTLTVSAKHLPYLFQLLEAPASLGLWLHPSSFHLHRHVPPPLVSESQLSLSCSHMTHITGFRPLSLSPAQSHFKILNLGTSSNLVQIRSHPSILVRSEGHGPIF